MTRKAYPYELWQRAMALLDEGEDIRTIEKRLDVPYTTIYGWRRDRALGVTQVRESIKPKGAGSGVIAPRPYARGMRWGAGW